MAVYRENTAYDLEAYHPAKYERQKPRVRLVENKHQPSALVIWGISPLKAILVGIIGIAIMSMMIYSRAKLTEISAQIDTVTSDLTTAQSEYTRLQTSIQSQAAPDNLEQIAEEQLGMAKLQNYQVEYVYLTEGDQVVVANGPTSWWDHIVNFFVNIKNTLLG